MLRCVVCLSACVCRSLLLVFPSFIFVYLVCCFISVHFDASSPWTRLSKGLDLNFVRCWCFVAVVVAVVVVYMI